MIRCNCCYFSHTLKNKKEGSVLLKIWLVCASAAIVTAYGRAHSLNQTLRSPGCPVRGNADDGHAVRCCYRGSSPSHLHPTTPSTGASLLPIPENASVHTLRVCSNSPQLPIIHPSPATRQTYWTRLSHDVLRPKTYAKKDDTFLHLLSSLFTGLPFLT